MANIEKSIDVEVPVRTAYNQWTQFEEFPRFMEGVERVDQLSDTRLHWVADIAGKRKEWDARITAEEQNSFIEWTSEPGADVANSGRVEFRDAGARGTVVSATIAYDPPGGIIGKVIAKMFQREPAIQARRDLRRFKQLMETGEIATPAMNPKQFEEMGL